MARENDKTAMTAIAAYWYYRLESTQYFDYIGSSHNYIGHIDNKHRKSSSSKSAGVHRRHRYWKCTATVKHAIIITVQCTKILERFVRTVYSLYLPDTEIAAASDAHAGEGVLGVISRSSAQKHKQNYE